MDNQIENTCPYCGDPIHPKARYCRACSRALVNAKPCPFCGEPILQSAIRCRYCSTWLTEKELKRLHPQAKTSVEPLDRLISSSSIGAFLTMMSLTAILYPPELHVTNEYIRLRRWTLLGLRVYDQRVSTRKVASVRFHKGIIWARITLETHGGAMADLTVPALDTDEAQQMVEILEGVIQRRTSESDDND